MGSTLRAGLALCSPQRSDRRRPPPPLRSGQRADALRVLGAREDRGDDVLVGGALVDRADPGVVLVRRWATTEQQRRNRRRLDVRELTAYELARLGEPDHDLTA